MHYILTPVFLVVRPFPSQTLCDSNYFSKTFHPQTTQHTHTHTHTYTHTHTHTHTYTHTHTHTHTYTDTQTHTYKHHTQKIVVAYVPPKTKNWTKEEYEEIIEDTLEIFKK